MIYTTKNLYLLTTIAFWLFVSDAGMAGDVLFVKALRNYNKKDLLGRVFRQELETRMFSHTTWRERLYINTYYPSKDETLEVYSRPDGSRWLSFRRATPSLSQPILDRIWLQQNFDLKKELDRASIRVGEIELPPDLANQLELLWQTMLPGPSKEPEAKGLYMDAPVFIAFVKQNDSVETGAMAFSAYHTPAYNEFVEITNDLIKLSENPGSKSRVLQKLPSKMRHLAARLSSR